MVVAGAWEQIINVFMYRFFFVRQDLISKQEIIDAMLRLKKIPDETKIEKIAEVLDEDKDGVIGLSEALKVLWNF